jgi:hypothetical protein
MSGKFTVTADRLSTADKDGNRTRYYRGDTITGLPEADVERFLRAGAIAKPSEPVAKDAEEHPAEVPHGESSWPEESDALPPASAIVAERNSTAPVTVERPPNAATKERWVEYAVASGQLSEDEAESLTRDKLRDRVG